MNKAKLKEMPSSGSCITYKILNSVIPPRDSSYLQARLIKVLLQLTRIIHDRHIPMSLAKRYKIYLFNKSCYNNSIIQMPNQLWASCGHAVYTTDYHNNNKTC